MGGRWRKRRREGEGDPKIRYRRKEGDDLGGRGGRREREEGEEER